MSTTTESKYGTNGQAITITLASQANNGQQQSTAIDNTSNQYLDALVQLTYKNGAGAPAAPFLVNVYAYGSTDNGLTYGDTCTGTNGSVTLTVPPELTLIGSINVPTSATQYKSNPMSVKAAFNGVLPDFWGIVVENKSGTAADGTAGNFLAEYQGIWRQKV